MKNLKKLLVLALVAIMALSVVACNGDEDEEGGNAPAERPTPKVNVVDVSAEQLNNYYVAYTVTKAGEMIQDAEGNYVEKTDATNYVEIGYSSVVLSSKDGGTSFTLGSMQCFQNTGAIETTPQGIFGIHLNYEKSELENKGKETVAGKECTHYYFKNGLMQYNMYVDESFGSTGICLKFVAEGYNPQTIEVTELKFGCINSEEGYNFVDFQSKVATPAPADDAAQ